MYKYLFSLFAVFILAGCGSVPEENSVQSANRIGSSALQALDTVEGAMDHTEQTAKSIAKDSKKVLADFTEDMFQRDIPLAEVAQHHTKDDCWLAVNARVYDVTPFIAQGSHPGKEAILAGCGKDATTLFESRPMGSATPHSQKAVAMLAQYDIGALIQ